MYDDAPYTEMFIFERSIPDISSVPEYVYFDSSVPYTTFMLLDSFDFFITFITASRIYLYFLALDTCSVPVGFDRYDSIFSSSLFEYIFVDVTIVKYDLFVIKLFIIFRLYKAELNFPIIILLANDILELSVSFLSIIYSSESSFQYIE